MGAAASAPFSVSGCVCCMQGDHLFKMGRGDTCLPLLLPPSPLFTAAEQGWIWAVCCGLRAPCLAAFPPGPLRLSTWDPAWKGEEVQCHHCCQKPCTSHGARLETAVSLQFTMVTPSRSVLSLAPAVMVSLRNSSGVISQHRIVLFLALQKKCVLK